MSLIDVGADSGGFLASITSSVDTLSGLVGVLIFAVCVLIAIEVARGVMKR